MKQYQAGYILDHLETIFEKDTTRKKNFKILAKWCSYFQMESRSRFEEETTEYPSQIAVLINLIQRGLPTLMNKHAVDMLVENSGLLSWSPEKETAFDLNYEESEEIKKLFFRSLHLIDPRLNVAEQQRNYQKSWEKLDSQYEEDFLFHKLPDILGMGGAALAQILALQRPMESIVGETSQDEIKHSFREQSTDFSIELPYSENENRKGMVIEVDGPQHDEPSQKKLDETRDEAVLRSKWHTTLRLKTGEFKSNSFAHKIEENIALFTQDGYVKHCIENFENPLWKTELGTEILELALIPFGVARIQRVILEAIAGGALDTEREVWKIGVLEKDIPCAHLALEDWRFLVDKINLFSETQLRLPEVELNVFSTKEFIQSNFQGKEAQLIESFDQEKRYDLLIDIAILDKNRHKQVSLDNAKEYITIRSIHYLEGKRKIISSDLIEYKPFCEKPNDSDVWKINDKEAAEGLGYILQSIFRKKKFREGQLPSLHHALQCKSVIGLLPTGGGKSLTYQLAAMLQPGVCLVIDPIRSLMKDQVDGLLRNKIDSCLYINSTLKGEEKRAEMEKLSEGFAQFAFISPERLQMEEFRSLLKGMSEDCVYFSYCVIDEAHCVSEWGHDFRTSYLRLGADIIKHCKVKGRKYIPLFGLTATASYDVLADVQRELSGDKEELRLKDDSVIRAEYSKRDELQFIIEKIDIQTDELEDIWDLKRALGQEKRGKAKQLLQEIPNTLQHFLNNPEKIFGKHSAKDENRKAFQSMQIKEYDPDSFYNNNSDAGLVFCPHRSWLFGVTDKYKKDRNGNPVNPREGYYDLLSEIDGINAGYFMGAGDYNNNDAREIETKSFGNQDKFIRNELNLMVATKAFGMGIDKENIRYSIHVNYPDSIEGYIQEAGRTGRDGKLALSYILFNNQKVHLPKEESSIDHDAEINLHFHRQSFKGIGKELAVLDEYLTEVCFENRLVEMKKKIINQLNLDEKLRLNYYEWQQLRRIYIENEKREPLGFFDLEGKIGHTNYIKRGEQLNSVSPQTSEAIWTILENYVEEKPETRDISSWINEEVYAKGVEGIMKNKTIDDEFSLVIGFHNGKRYRLEKITQWMDQHIPVNSFFTDSMIKKYHKDNDEADSFFRTLVDRYNHDTGNNVEFEQVCLEVDKQSDLSEGTTEKRIKALYNGIRDKVDSEKAIYRLSILGVIDDYTVNYNAETFTLFGVKKPQKAYKENLKNYLQKYYSEKAMNAKLKGFNKIQEKTTLRKSLTFLVSFIYDEVQKKRERSIYDMKEACHIGLEKGSSGMRDYIDLYFNSKYARSGYKYTNNKGEKVDASLIDLTNEGKDDKIEWVWFFIKVVNEDTSAAQINNWKHLRGACTRVLSNQPDNYTLILLNTYTLYMLEYENPKYLGEAEMLLISAFTVMQEKEKWSEDKLRKIFEQFKAKGVNDNPKMEEYMEGLEFEAVMLPKLREVLHLTNNTLHKLNEKLS